MRKTKFRGCWGQLVCGTVENMVQHRVLCSQGSPHIDICSPFSLFRMQTTHLFWGFCFMGVGGISSGNWRPDKWSVATGAARSVSAAARSDEILSIFNFKKRLFDVKFIFQKEGIQNCFLNEVKCYFVHFMVLSGIATCSCGILMQISKQFLAGVPLVHIQHVAFV